MMLMSEQLQQAMDEINEMKPSDPGNKVKNKLIELKKEAPKYEAEFFDELWEAYIAAKEVE